ncbi:regulator of nonsense transcripts 3B isoform X2 [Plodia interpunctella]|uniref:regulator of nonsense transcripts 3B isoform X2 n=1 Tax=Plodia interpunctella TaxID=58824 RepID=UPI002367773B|nr:regulator of nonsense transcripts 3B isoform X2 [Plodia interpunctella]
MTEDQDAKDSQSDSGSKNFASKNKDKKIKPQRPLTKIVLRRLPPSMTEEAFLEQVSPIPEHDHFYFAKPDTSLGHNVYSRAYINFVNVEDIYLFRDKFDGYIFLDEKGVEYVGIVEYALFQRIPKKKKKKDPKCGTIESDPIYQEFIESLTKDPESENQPKLEFSYPVNDGNDKKVQSTPLLEYLAARKQNKSGRDERRRRENDKRKMRIERKTKEMPIKRPGDISDDETYTENCDYSEHKHKNFWFGEQRVYHKSKLKATVKPELKNVHGSDEFISTDSDWDSQFPALSMKTHNTFTLTSGKFYGKEETVEPNEKSGGDTCVKEEETGEEVKKIKSREWEKEKSSTDLKDDSSRSEIKDGAIYESKTYREQRKAGNNAVIDKKVKKTEGDKKEISGKDVEQDEDSDRGFKRDKRDKFKESPRESKSKKYSDTRKERIKQTEFVKSEKQSVINKIISSDGKSKSLNHDDIKPFTQLPQVKTDDLTKIIEGMDKKMKLEEAQKEHMPDNVSAVSAKTRRSSLESGEMTTKDESVLKRQKSLDDRSKSTDREGSEEKEKSESGDRRTERRIRNKDRPSMVIYQPGMGKFSKQRLAKEKDTQPQTAAKPVNDSEKKDT